MKTFLAAVMALTFAGCAATTAKIEPARLSELQKGRTTFDEVVHRFGRPSVISRNPGGDQSATYYFSNGGEAMVTLMAATPKDSTTFYFDTKGVLTDYKASEAPKSAPPVAAQTSNPAVA